MRIHNNINYRSQADICFYDMSVCICVCFCNDFSIIKVCVKLVGNYPGNICMNEDHKKFNSLWKMNKNNKTINNKGFIFKRKEF